MSHWGMQKTALGERLTAGRRHSRGKIVPITNLAGFLKAVIRTGDRVCLEGETQGFGGQERTLLASQAR